MKNIVIIPARYASTRFPGKPLALVQGKPMIQRVYERASQAAHIDGVWVATDDARILAAVQGFGGEALRTRADHVSGTDRCAEALAQLQAQGLAPEIVVNVQGDEPFIAPSQVDALVAHLAAQPLQSVATLAKSIKGRPDLLANPNVVKVVFGVTHQALYFSRYGLPFVRDAGAECAHWKHLGMYAYRAATLAALSALPPHPLELAESLEQLRWLAHGYAIGVVPTAHESMGIDTPEDLARANEA